MEAFLWQYAINKTIFYGHPKKRVDSVIKKHMPVLCMNKILSPEIFNKPWQIILFSRHQGTVFTSKPL